MSTERQFKPLAASIICRSNTNYQKERYEEETHRQRDAAFVRMVLMAMWNGDNVPAGQPKPLRLLG